MKVPNVPHCTPAQYPSGIASTRFASTIQTTSSEGCAIAILGLPDDLGVRLNNGRPGAKDGPRAFREAISKYGVSAPYECDFPRVFDAGDVQPAPGDSVQSLHETHNRVSAASEFLAKAGLLVIGIGGGHDLTYPLVRGAYRALGQKPLCGVYFDPHLDVRETPGSGMSFRKLIEEKIASRLRIVGYNPLVNHRDHTDWFVDNHGAIALLGADPFGGLELSGSFVSVDMDCIDMSAAPGVSAPNPSGIAPAILAEHMQKLGTHFNLASLDFMELCPAHDEGARTARLAAHLFLSFLYGMGLRNQRVRNI